MSTTIKQKPVVPELRFSGFSGELSKNKLGDIALVKRGAASQHLTYTTKKDRGSIRLIRINDFLSDKPAYVELTEDMSKFTLQKNDLLIAGTGATAGIVFIVPDAFVGLAYSYNAPRIRVNKNVNHRYFYEYLKSEKILHQQKRLFVGNAQPFLDTDAIRSFVINLPELPEQQKIAEFLGSVDAWLDNLRGQKTALQSYKQGMMQKLFTAQVRFKDEAGRNYPEWQEVSMSDIGGSFGGLSGKSGDDFGQGESFITYKQIFDDSIIEPEKFAQVTVAPGEKQNRAQKGDVFFTVSSETPNEVGYASVLMEDVNPYLNSFAFGFRPKSITDLLPEYSRYHFRSAPFRRQVVRLAQGSTSLRNTTDVKETDSFSNNKLIAY